MRGDRLLFVAILAVIAGCLGATDDPATQVSGTVTDSTTGLAIGSAAVHFGDTASTQPNLTDSVGRYSVSRLGFGLHRLYCRKEGYLTSSRSVHSSRTDRVFRNIDFRLVTREAGSGVGR